MGSTITYYRRYAIQSLLFLQAEDDDANSAMQPPKSAGRQAAKSPDRKAVIASLLKRAMPGIATADDYKDATMKLTGLELTPANYQQIIDRLKTTP